MSTITIKRVLYFPPDGSDPIVKKVKPMPVPIKKHSKKAQKKKEQPKKEEKPEEEKK